MGNKIIAEFNRRKLEETCRQWRNERCAKGCNMTDKDLVRCFVNIVDFKIKEQSK